MIAITGDDMLLEQIGKVLDAESTVRHADGPEEAQDLLRPAQAAVVLLDSRGLDELERVVQGLQSLDGLRVVVGLAAAGQTEDVARSVRGSAAFAVLGIPFEEPQARAVIEGAREEVLARHALLVAPAPAPAARQLPPTHPASVAVTTDPVDEEAPWSDKHARTFAAASKSIKRKTVIVGIGGALFAVGLLVVLLNLRSPTPTIAPSPTRLAPAPVANSAAVPLATRAVDDLLDSARTAMRERRYSDPESNNALHFYTSVLAQDPQNGEAREGLTRIAAVLRERVQSAIEERHVDEAARTLAQLETLRPGDSTLAPLEAKVTDARIAKAIEAGDVTRAADLLSKAQKSQALPSDRLTHWQAELDRRQATARSGQLAQLISSRIRQGKLTEPAADSAKYYLAQLRQLPATSPDLVGSAAEDYQQACLGRLREAIVKGQRADVERWKNEARAAGVSATELADAQREANARAKAQDADREIARLAQLVQDRIADGRLLEPAGDSAMVHVATLRRLDAAGTVAVNAERALSARLLDSGRAALQAKQLDAAKAFASGARQLGANIEAVGLLERDVAAASSARAVATETPLVRTRFVAPVYPKEALEERLKGDVHLQITVDADGKVKDAAVLQSNLPKAFNEAAMQAARRWRFKPIGAKGSDTERTASVTIVFQPEAAQP
jgi:protein TonB